MRYPGLFAISACLLTSIGVAADYRTPAGTNPAHRTEDGAGTVLLGGRLLSPFGTEYTTGPGPFGLAISPDGTRIVTSDGGLDRTSLSFLEKIGGAWHIRNLPISPKEISATGDDDWKSTFMGLAFNGGNSLYASEGESGQIYELDPASGKRLGRYDLNVNGFADSYSGDLALDAQRGILYAVDQANFRVVAIDVRLRLVLASVRVGRLPFAITLSPDRRRVYVTNVGMFAYQPIPGARQDAARTTGLSFPPFGFPSAEARDGVTRENASGKAVAVPGLGDPNVPESNSLCVLDVSDPAHPRVIKFLRTGLPFGERSLAGSSPAGVLATDAHVYVSNSVNDSISVIDPNQLVVTKTIELRIPGLEAYRGILPIGMAYYAQRKEVLVAEGGINAVGVIDADPLTLRGHIPAGWFPTRIGIYGDTVYVTNAKGHGIGPNATPQAPLPHSFELEKRRGSLSQYQVPAPNDLPTLTNTVMRNNGFYEVADKPPPPAAIHHVVIIVKENRTFDEVFGDVDGART